VIITSYMDESGTHKGLRRTTMAAIMGNARQWSRFESELDKIKKQYAFQVFHTKDFKSKSGEFSEWSNEKCLAVVSKLSLLTGQGLMHGSVFGVTDEIYKRYRVQMPPRVRLESKYGLCFRMCLINQISEIDRRLSSHKKYGSTRLHVVVESGHKNAGDAERLEALLSGGPVAPKSVTQ
jgi:hypothetical protein